MNNLSMNYNLQQTENSLFSATFRLRSNSQPHWDYQGVLTNVADSDDKVGLDSFRYGILLNSNPIFSSKSSRKLKITPLPFVPYKG